MNSIRIQSKIIGSVKSPNCKFTCLQVLHLLVLFPFFSIKNAAGYSSSALGKLFACHKDMFYRFMNDGKVNWRRIIYSVFRQLYSRVSRRTALESDIRCVIIDDTDPPKEGERGRESEEKRNGQGIKKGQWETDLLSGKRDSNSRPRPWQGRALPTELFPRLGGQR